MYHLNIIIIIVQGLRSVKVLARHMQDIYYNAWENKMTHKELVAQQERIKRHNTSARQISKMTNKEFAAYLVKLNGAK